MAGGDGSGDGLEDLAAIASAVRGLEVFDCSPPIDSELPVFFVYPPPELRELYPRSPEVGNSTAFELRMPEHAGTHVDAPFHMYDEGETMDQVDPAILLLRPYKKYDLSGFDPQPGELIGAERLQEVERRDDFELEPGDVAIIEMGWSRHLPDGSDPREPGWWGLNQPGLDDSACLHLTSRGITAVASDTAACDLAAKDGEVSSAVGHSDHFLPKGVLIVESVRNLAAVPTRGLIVAVPLKIKGGTGSPLRVLLLAERW